MPCQALEPKAYSSRKLLDLLDERAKQTNKLAAASAAVDIIQELTQRGHYLTELAERGLIKRSTAT